MNNKHQLKLTTSFLKLSESVMMELIPASDNYLDKKEFTWDVISYDSGGLGFKLNFKHPKYISTNGYDTLKVTFKQAFEYINP